MKLKEKLSYFWNVTLGEDYIEQENIEESTNPEYTELKESLVRVQAIEDKFNKPTSSKRGGRAKSEKNKVVETVSVDSKIATKVTVKEPKVKINTREER